MSGTLCYHLICAVLTVALFFGPSLQI